jgi:hypothetical protein
MTVLESGQQIIIRSELGPKRLYLAETSVDFNFYLYTSTLLLDHVSHNTSKQTAVKYCFTTRYLIYQQQLIWDFLTMKKFCLFVFSTMLVAI